MDNRIVRLQVYCTNDERAEYLYIRVSGEEATCDDIEDLCTVRWDPIPSGRTSYCVEFGVLRR